MDISGRNAGVAAGIAGVLVVVAFVVGRATAPSTADGTDAGLDGAAPATTEQATSAPSPAPSPSAPSRSRTTSPSPSPSSTTTDSDRAVPSAVASGAPGESSLAASGSASQTLTFTPRRASWQVSADYRCRRGESFTLEVRRAGEVVAVLASDGEQGTVTEQLTTAGEHTLAVLGNCSWAVRATG